jgi:Secretion system C-terminal sorting domain
VYGIALVLMTLMSSISVQAQSGCIMTCPPMDPPYGVNLSSDCEDVLTPELLNVGLFGCSDEIDISILDNGIPIGDVITANMIGNTYMVIVTDVPSGQSCMTTIIVNDKQAPLVNCPEDVTLACNSDLSEYNGLLPQDISDCSETEVSIDDQLQSSGNCAGDIISQYLRTYTVVDEYGNAAICEQLISLAKASLADVTFPPNLTGTGALECFPAPDTSPDHTGYPTVDGNDILNGTFCNLSAVYTDIQIPLCIGSYKIMRTWTVVDWCNNNQSTSATQVIEVLDKTDPIVDAPDDMTVSTGVSECLADVIVPAAIIIEDCSGDISVRMEGPFGTIHSNGGLIQDLPIGVHRIIFKATNDCDSVGVDTMYITVQDLQPPVPICHQQIAIPVNNDGFAFIPASVFNGGSYDNCYNVYFKVRRMTTPVGDECFNPGNPNNLFDDFIQFCCEDIANNNIMVVFRVYDVPPIAGPVSASYLQGHFNDCMVQVEVQDKLPPSLICPSDLTISCEFPYTPGNLEVFGTVATSEAERELICIDDPGVPGDPGLQCIGLDGLALDNCSVQVEELDPVITVNNCGTGTIVRTFVATDDGGLQSTCQQVITIINYDPFDLADITWPADYTTFDICEIDLLDPEDLSPPFNQPSLNDEPCDLVAASHEDDVFDFSHTDQACFKIVRTWTVIDWCQLNTPAGGIWTHMQIIKVMNNTAPVIEPITDLDLCSYDPECGGLTIDFEASAEDDCSGPASLNWKYFIDLQNNNSFDYVSGVILGESIEFSRYMPIGTHRVVYTVEDKCGNASTEEQIVTIESCKLPSPKCIHGLSTNLMAMDTDGDGTADWGMVTLQAEMFDGGSDHPCGNPITVAFSSDPADVTRVFDCGDLGTNEIELWAIDQNGLSDFCITYIEIQDNNGICPPEGGSTGIISGNITVPQAGSLGGAMVYLDGSTMPGAPTGTDGHFVFPGMPLGGEYIVRPIREGDARNGVTTLDLVRIQKHLLGLQNFTTPYQFIAADANSSASVTAIDIVQLRKLILGYYNELPNNKSWRFIDKGHVFPDPMNPWLSPWPETYNIIPFSNSMNDVDFHGIKIGDLNLSASLQLGNGMLVPRGNQPCVLEYEVIAQDEVNLFKVDLYVLQDVTYNAIQFSLDWDQNSFELVDWNPGEGFSREDFRMPAHNGENASVSTYSLEGWADQKVPLLSLWVKAKSGQGYPFQLFLSPTPTPPIAYAEDEEEGFVIQLKAGASSVSKAYNRPNPFRDMTTIFMESNRQEKAVLRVFDLNGRTVFVRDVNLVVGENEFIVNKTQLREAGIYVYEIESNFQYSTNRMIIVD